MRLDGFAQLVGDGAGLRARAVLEQDRELIAAEARHRVVLAHVLAQQRRHFLEHGIAGLVSTGMVG